MTALVIPGRLLLARKSEDGWRDRVTGERVNIIRYPYPNKIGIK